MQRAGFRVSCGPGSIVRDRPALARPLAIGASVYLVWGAYGVIEPIYFRDVLQSRRRRSPGCKRCSVSCCSAPRCRCRGSVTGSRRCARCAAAALVTAVVHRSTSGPSTCGSRRSGSASGVRRPHGSWRRTARWCTGRHRSPRTAAARARQRAAESAALIGLPLAALASPRSACEAPRSESVRSPSPAPSSPAPAQLRSRPTRDAGRRDRRSSGREPPRADELRADRGEGLGVPGRGQSGAPCSLAPALGARAVHTELHEPKCAEVPSGQRRVSPCARSSSTARATCFGDVIGHVTSLTSRPASHAVEWCRCPDPVLADAEIAAALAALPGWSAPATRSSRRSSARRSPTRSRSSCGSGSSPSGPTTTRPRHPLAQGARRAHDARRRRFDHPRHRSRDARSRDDGAEAG